MTDIPLSVLDLPMIEADRPTSEILSGLTEVARRVEELGYRRLWYPEHHATAGIADFPPAIVSAHVAAVTSTIRVGSGGVLAPNHVPLSVAEQFGALAALHPGRIDLGIGRGPGTLDQQATRALRRGAGPTTDDEYRDDVANVLDLVGERDAAPNRGCCPRARPVPDSRRDWGCRSRSRTTFGRGTPCRRSPTTEPTSSPPAGRTRPG